MARAVAAPSAADVVRAALEPFTRATPDPTLTLLDSIGQCPDSVKASAALARAIALDTSTISDPLPAPPGWLLPP